MDATKYTKRTEGVTPLLKLQRHLRAIRMYQHEVAEIILFLSETPPDCEAAKEVLESLDTKTQIDLWSCSTKDGGMWERWQRDALKHGELTDAYRIWCERKGIPYANVD